ncbi:hypothetical protein EMA8858_03218 [Emticicia aquatica]|uniref:DUF5916 domain-containing protein n=1 Tax=Emticicia aquatica TaxID=1681835 RepID=A0ABM9ASV0_9BACT|nr:DUF5916 domain-containing protein [Emticicia aquatica]CAH0997081.1 hypothetical protein EMA8858_03218 [Emticicia aquatica]
MKKLILFLLTLSSVGLKQTFGQIVPRSLEAKRTTKAVIIDGKLNDLAWQDAAKADDYTEFRPVIGRKEEKGNHTETFLMYDDAGIYFGGTCFERNIDSIAKELVGRDGFGTNDYIGLIFDTYNDKLNGFEYFLTPLGEQWDAKMTSNQNSNNGGEDFSWNAVWKSAVVIHDKGWSFEMFLPYSAIRFSKDKVQNWGMNITRRRRKTEQQYTWNAINPNINGFLTQEGQWTGITNIKPPLRLQLFPYFSVYGNHFPTNLTDQKNWTNQISGGLDLKLGLNQAFTLDATLIPDFGQVQSDNKVLNLTPFEVKFNEYRSFFTEGTELFNKGNLFYSRRIGGTPIHLYDAYDDVKSNEKMIKNPSEAKLINASKISGRTKNGLGIGILNAVTQAQFATIENIETGEIRKFETNPTTNYNLIVLDQTFKHNSSISFVNTNVTRGSNDYNANVSAGLFSFFDKKNTYNLSGSASVSRLKYKTSDSENALGYSHTLSFGKTSGRFNFNVSQALTDTKFNSNDLGYFTNNNFINHSFYVGYRYTEPKGWYNRLFLNLNGSLSNLFSPIGNIKSKYQQSNLQVNINAQTKKLIWFGLFGNYRPAQNDFYEPRNEGYVFKRGNSIALGGWIESNSAKKYSINAEAVERVFLNFYKISGIDLFLGQNYRFSSKFSIGHQIGFQPRPRGLGYTATLDDNSILFAIRKVNTVDNVLNLKYNFTNKMGLTFRARHYVSVVDNKEFYTLNENGSLDAKTGITDKHNRNVNYFNIDMVYTWQFAPGSFLNAVWKNAGFTNSDIANTRYLDNFQNTIQSDQNNNLSLKIIYFLDYLQLKRKV